MFYFLISFFRTFYTFNQTLFLWKLADAREHITDLTNANNLLGIDKRRLEGDLRGAQQELDNLVNAVKHAEEKARKAISDAGNICNVFLYDFKISVILRIINFGPRIQIVSPLLYFDYLFRSIGGWIAYWTRTWISCW